MVTMDQLVHIRNEQGKEALQPYLLSVSTAVDNWPEARISQAAAYYIRQGQPVIIPYAPPRGWVKLIRKEGDFLGVGEILDDGRVAPRRLVGSG
jgi:tRNA pseudouridine55 synthase